MTRDASSITRTDDDPPVHASGDGRDLERSAPLRDLARGGARRGRRDGRGRPGAARRRAPSCAPRRRFDIARIEEIEAVTQHDVIAFTTAVAEKVGPAARWLHFGLTSSDVIDTAQALQMREACASSSRTSASLMEAVRERAEEHRRTPMIGRTHGVHAEPMTFGLKLALWYAELQRDLDRAAARARRRVGRQDLGRGRHLRAPRPGDRGATSASGSASSRRRCPRRSSSAIATPSCCRRSPSPARRWRSSRSRSAACRRPRSARSRSRSARARRARRRCRTSATRSAASRSSGWRGCCAPTRMAALENIALWHERDISHSSVERVILPDSFIALDHMLRRFTRIVRGMVVYPERMLENLDRSRGVVFSGTLLLELAKRGVSREQAYEWVQRNAMRVVPRAARLQGAAARRSRRHRACCRRRRSTRRSTSRSSCATWTRSWIASSRPTGGQVGRAEPAMEPMKARVFVTLKKSVFDPQGKTIADALHSLGYGGVGDVRQGKFFELELDARSADQARAAGHRSRRQGARQSGHRKLPCRN